MSADLGTVIVTGGASGLGAAIALAVRDAGGALVVLDRRPPFDGVAHELRPFEAYVLPGGVEHSAYCGPEGALVLDVFTPVREDYLERWHPEGD